jgi:hypothetical protein
MMQTYPNLLRHFLKVANIVFKNFMAGGTHCATWKSLPSNDWICCLCAENLSIQARNNSVISDIFLRRDGYCHRDRIKKPTRPNNWLSWGWSFMCGFL